MVKHDTCIHTTCHADVFFNLTPFSIYFCEQTDRAEEEHEDSPIQTAATPRSKRKSAQLVSSRIRKQL